jgi:hypothetical protein
MKVGDTVFVSGCVVQEKFVAGRTLAQIEQILGFHAGRLAQGMTVVGLLGLPALKDFDVAGYTNVATHRHVTPPRLDLDKIKAIARGQWTSTGTGRLVKVFPTIRHDPAMNPDVQYPPGQGAPQWILRGQHAGKVLFIVTGSPGARLPPSAGAASAVTASS